VGNSAHKEREERKRDLPKKKGGDQKRMYQAGNTAPAIEGKKKKGVAA